MKNWWRGRRLSRALRQAIRERQALQTRPWEEDLLHWAKDGTLHGQHLPPVLPRRAWPFRLVVPGAQRVSTTSDGWCPGWALEVQRAYLPDIDV